MSFAEATIPSLTGLLVLFSSRSPSFFSVRVIASRRTRIGVDAVIASECFVFVTFSHGRGSAPFLTGFSEENLYSNFWSSPVWWRIS